MLLQGQLASKKAAIFMHITSEQNRATAPVVSIVIPSYNAPRDHLQRLYDSLKTQTLQLFEVIIVDDCSRVNFYDMLEDARFRVLYQEKNTGPAHARNTGAACARSELLFFTDTDCELEPETLGNAVASIDGWDIQAGDTITNSQTWFGKAVAYLGFPGGGLLGFDKVWPVNGDGSTHSFSSCNVCMYRNVFEQLQGFDATFPVPGGEDTVFARLALESGFRIHYSPKQRVRHVERGDWSGFVRWQLLRGRGNFHIKRKVGKVGGYLRLRLWSMANSLKAAGWRLRPIVFFLWGAAVVLQTVGYYKEKAAWAKRERRIR